MSAPRPPHARVALRKKKRAAADSIMTVSVHWLSSRFVILLSIGCVSSHFINVQIQMLMTVFNAPSPCWGIAISSAYLFQIPIEMHIIGGGGVQMRHLGIV